MLPHGEALLRLVPVTVRYKKQTGPCAAYDCGDLIVKGDVVVEYDDFAGTVRQHVVHWQDSIRHQATVASERQDGYEAFGESLLRFLGGLSAVDRDWIERQRRALSEIRRSR
jgi:hypothetical protein